MGGVFAAIRPWEPTGASKLSSATPVETTAETVRTMLASTSAVSTAEARQTTDDDDDHDAVRHVAEAMKPVDVASSVAKSRPPTVTDARPDATPALCGTDETAGASKLKSTGLTAVPTTATTVSSVASGSA